MKKLIALVLALALVLAVAVASAANTTKTIASGKGGSGSITINGANPDQSYGFYKLFDAFPNAAGTSVSYKLRSSFTAPADGDPFYTYFNIDSAGNITITNAGKDSNDATKLSTAAVSYLNSNYTTLGELVYTAQPGHDDLGTGSTAFDLTVSELPYGYYYITSTTGTTCSVDTVQPNATTTEKNPGTTIDKTITGVGTGSIESTDKEAAIAQVGTTVNYSARVNIANGARDYIFTDKMGHGLTLDASSVHVYLVTKDAALDGTETAETAGTDAATKYGTLTAANNATDGENDIRIVFNQAWLTANVGKDIIVTYSATVNNTALIADPAGNPNKATIEWGDTSNFLKHEDEAKVYSARITVKKVDGSNHALEGAGFVLKNTSGKYYKNTDGVISWVDAETNATEIFPLKSNDTNTDHDTDEKKEAVAFFTGLANGTYTLVEKTVPAGFNKAADSTVTIEDADASDLNLDLKVSTTVTNNSGTELPSTGGIGTTIFYILGGLLVIGAAVILVARRKAQD